MSRPAALLAAFTIGAKLFGPGYIQRGVGPPSASVSLPHRAGKKHIMNPQIPANTPMSSIPRRINIEPSTVERTRQASSLSDDSYFVFCPSSAACTRLCFRLYVKYTTIPIISQIINRAQLIQPSLYIM
jgi:hypothetical protein